MSISDSDITSRGKPPPRGCIVAVLVGAALLVLAVVFALAVDRNMAAQVEREIAAIRAAGKPVTAAEAAPPSVAAADNAAPLYEAAAAAGRPAAESVCQLDWRDPRWLATVEPCLARNRRSLALVTAAAKLPKCRIDLAYEDGYRARNPHLAEFRSLARRLRTAATAAALRRDGTAAAQRVREGLVLSRHLAEHASLLALLTVQATDEIALSGGHRALDLAPPALPEAVALSEELQALDYVAAVSHAADIERSWRLDAYRLARQSPAALSFLPYPVYSVVPVPPDERLKRAGMRALETGYRRTALLWADELRYLDVAAKAEGLLPLPWRESHARWSSVGTGAALPRQMSGAMEPGRLFPSLVVKRDLAIARRGLLQTALALHQYKAEHRNYPASLSVVRIDGLPIPDDVFSGKPFVYRRTGDGFVLYSIGPNLRDDGGRDDYKAGDLVWDVRP